MPIDYRPRLTVDITEDQFLQLQKHLERGVRRVVFQAIVADLLRLFEQHGAGIVIGALVERAISLKDICKLDLKGIKNGNNRQSGDVDS